MNIQNLFTVVKESSGEHTLVVVARELERQGYTVTFGDRFHGSTELAATDRASELDGLPVGVGIRIKVEKESETQSFLLHFLDLGAICLTDQNSPPVIYDPKFTIDEFRSSDSG